MNGPSYPDHPCLLLTRIKLCSGLRCYIFGELGWHRNLVHLGAKQAALLQAGNFVYAKMEKKKRLVPINVPDSCNEGPAR